MERGRAKTALDERDTMREVAIVDVVIRLWWENNWWRRSKVRDAEGNTPRHSVLLSNTSLLVLDSSSPLLVHSTHHKMSSVTTIGTGRIGRHLFQFRNANILHLEPCL